MHGFCRTGTRGDSAAQQRRVPDTITRAESISDSGSDQTRVNCIRKHRYCREKMGYFLLSKLFLFIAFVTLLILQESFSVLPTKPSASVQGREEEVHMQLLVYLKTFVSRGDKTSVT